MMVRSFRRAIRAGPRTTLLFLGLDGSGKTSVVRKLQDLDHDCPPDFILPTIGCAIETVDFMRTWPLLVLDMSGQSYFRPLVDRYWRFY